MEKLVVTGVAKAPELFAAAKISHAISFRDSSFEYPPIADLFLNIETNWLRLYFSDQVFRVGSAEFDQAIGLIEQIIAFARGLPEDARLGVNCYAGVSRSTATAMIAAVARLGMDQGERLFLTSVPGGTPNPTLIEIADGLMDLDGKLVDLAERFTESYLRQSGVLIPTYLIRDH